MSTLADVHKLRAEIDALDQAIAAARQGSSYTIDGQTYTRQELPILRDERTRAVRELREAEAVIEGARNSAAVIATWHR